MPHQQLSDLSRGAAALTSVNAAAGSCRAGQYALSHAPTLESCETSGRACAVCRPCEAPASAVPQATSTCSRDALIDCKSYLTRTSTAAWLSLRGSVLLKCSNFLGMEAGKPGHLLGEAQTL